jgi:hypothetical protein
MLVSAMLNIDGFETYYIRKPSFPDSAAIRGNICIRLRYDLHLAAVYTSHLNLNNLSPYPLPFSKGRGSKQKRGAFAPLFKKLTLKNIFQCSARRGSQGVRRKMY